MHYMTCIIARERNLEISPPSNEQNFEQTDDQLAKNETLAAVSVASDEPQGEQTARQVPRLNENVGVATANALPPEHPKILEQESTSVGSSNFGVCPASEGISESQSVAVQDQITDSTVESADSVTRIEPEPSTSGYSGQKRKRNANTDSAEAKKNSRANERKANASQDGRYYCDGVCQIKQRMQPPTKVARDQSDVSVNELTGGGGRKKADSVLERLRRYEFG
ncbi:Hypothetical predicted protein [Cloeon dipterum]|uniref:Uncharacterized protein n=1 Tax=Cloeon dipterum TaxID=197152 RepID=A0A8S1DA86_9INSE|nr:Hypothetical predicted protein [Cloeon dipterum]